MHFLLFPKNNSFVDIKNSLKFTIRYLMPNNFYSKHLDFHDNNNTQTSTISKSLSTLIPFNSMIDLYKSSSFTICRIFSIFRLINLYYYIVYELFGQSNCNHCNHQLWKLFEILWNVYNNMKINLINWVMNGILSRINIMTQWSCWVSNNL